VARPPPIACVTPPAIGACTHMEDAMNWDRIEGNWKQLKGSAQAKWGKLTNDDLDQIEGNRDKMIGKLQERYGMAKDKAEAAADDWYQSV
jgi:uncharacterized protein YjbJ (UPF0337 family)